MGTLTAAKKKCAQSQKIGGFSLLEVFLVLGVISTAIAPMLWLYHNQQEDLLKLKFKEDTLRVVETIDQLSMGQKDYSGVTEVSLSLVPMPTSFFKESGMIKNKFGGKLSITTHSSSPQDEGQDLLTISMGKVPKSFCVEMASYIAPKVYSVMVNSEFDTLDSRYMVGLFPEKTAQISGRTETSLILLQKQCQKENTIKVVMLKPTHVVSLRSWPAPIQEMTAEELNRVKPEWDRFSYAYQKREWLLSNVSVLK